MERFGTRQLCVARSIGRSLEKRRGFYARVAAEATTGTSRPQPRLSLAPEDQPCTALDAIP
jgi:hypothetical protein